MRINIAFPLMVTSLTLSSCASLAEGTTEASTEILFSSSPSGAEVAQGPRHLCKTPCQVRRNELRRGEGFDFKFKDGESISIDAEYKVNGTILGNIIFGGAIGGVVDLVTGRLIVRSDHIHVDANR